MTSLLHLFPETGAFGRKIQLAELDYLVGSRAAADRACRKLCRLAV